MKQKPKNLSWICWLDYYSFKMGEGERGAEMSKDPSFLFEKWEKKM